MHAQSALKREFLLSADFLFSWRFFEIRSNADLPQARTKLIFPSCVGAKGGASTKGLTSPRKAKSSAATANSVAAHDVRVPLRRPGIQLPTSH
jgi:hypothetical protein